VNQSKFWATIGEVGKGISEASLALKRLGINPPVADPLLAELCEAVAEFDREDGLPPPTGVAWWVAHGRFIAACHRLAERAAEKLANPTPNELPEKLTPEQLDWRFKLSVPPLRPAEPEQYTAERLAQWAKRWGATPGAVVTPYAEAWLKTEANYRELKAAVWACPLEEEMANSMMVESGHAETVAEAERDVMRAAKTDALQAEVERLQAVVDRLPKFADGALALPRDIGYHPSGYRTVIPGVVGNGLVGNYGRSCRVSELYSTPEAARAAEEDKCDE